MTKKILIATYSLTGTTQRDADQLAQLLNDADQYRIDVPSGTFPNGMYAVNDVALKQIDDNDWPQLSDKLPDLSDYDLVIVASPVWSGYPATPVHTFLDQLQAANFKGQLASLYTDMGSKGDYEAHFKQWAGQLPVVSFNENGQGMSSWVKQLQ